MSQTTTTPTKEGAIARMEAAIAKIPTELRSLEQKVVDEVIAAWDDVKKHL